MMRSFLSSTLLCTLGAFSGPVALADEAPAAPAEAAAAPEAPPAPQTFVATGAPLAIEALGIVVTPPKGWEVVTGGGQAVVMREPKSQIPDYVNPTYQKNITIATIHQPSPIDERRAVELEAQLVQNFTADGSVSDFRIMEHKFFNFHGASDGLLVYSSLTLASVPMIQMHVLVSGEAKQFLLTYTDMARTFGGTKDAAYNAAWESMVSIQVAGETPQRNAEYLRYGALGGGFLLVFMLAGFFRFRASRKDYKGDADAMIDSEDADLSLHDSAPLSSAGTIASTWRLNGSYEDSAYEDEDRASSGYASSIQPKRRKKAQRTKPSSAIVSNY